MPPFKRLTTSTNILGDFSIGVLPIGSAQQWDPRQVSEGELVSVGDQITMEPAGGFGCLPHLWTRELVFGQSFRPLPERTGLPSWTCSEASYFQDIDETPWLTEPYPSLVGLRNTCYSLINCLDERQLRDAAELLARLITTDETTPECEDVELESSPVSAHATASAISMLLARSKHIRSLPATTEFEDIGE